MANASKKKTSAKNKKTNSVVDRVDKEELERLAAALDIKQRAENYTKNIENGNLVVQNNLDGYTCSMCGKNYKTQKEGFFENSSVLYRGNSGRMTICKSCLNHLYEHYCNVLKNPKQAARRVCMKFDIYYSDEICESVLGYKEAVGGIMAQIVRKGNSQAYKDKTYDNTIEEEGSAAIVSKAEMDFAVERSKRENEKEITEDMQKRWNFGFTPDEMHIAEEHYQYLKRNNPSAKENQEDNIINLCSMKVLQKRAFLAGDIKSYNDSIDAYQRLFAKSKLIIGDETAMDESAQAWGTFIEQIEKYCPADIYTQPSLFKDVDKIKEYFQRFIVRPFRNFFFNEHVMDAEFNVDDNPTSSDVRELEEDE